MTALLSAIVTWLAINFNLPATYDHPKVEFVPASRISDLLYAEIDLSRRREVLGLYDDASRTILLSDGWAGKTPAELSILVHEMVRHLQRATGHTELCPAAREKLAYSAQEKWLGLFGRDLKSEFEIDPMTLKVSTTCWW